jgi:hypothetical protein
MTTLTHVVRASCACGVWIGADGQHLDRARPAGWRCASSAVPPGTPCGHQRAGCADAADDSACEQGLDACCGCCHPAGDW